MAKKRVKAGSVEEAKKSLGAEKVVSTGRGEFTTPEALAEKTRQGERRFINQTEVDPKDYERLKRTPAFVQSTMRAPGNIQQIPIGQRTPEQQALTGETALQEQSQIELLKQQVLDPDLGLRDVGTTPEGASSISFGHIGEQGGQQPTPKQAPEGATIPGVLEPTTMFKVGDRDVAVPNEVVIGNEAKNQVKGLVTTRIDKDTSIINAEAQLVFQGMTTKASRFLGGGGVIDKKLSNMEASLINHKESSAQVIQALQRGAYTPEEAMDRLNQMADDVSIVAEAMKILSIYSPAVYADNKGWEYITRVQKIREAILTNQQGVLNFAQTGNILPPDTGALAMQLSELQLK